ncbi:MAG: phosphohistidine phosphatase SixA [Thalassotalea sp.]
MQLYIMRHGEAHHQGLSDSERELTTFGISEVVDIAKIMSEEIFDLIIVSPFVRAQQTADILVETLKLTSQVQQCDLITPVGSASQVHDYIDGLLASNPYQKILLVSHMPLVSFLLAELTIGGHMPIFQTSGVAKIDYDPAVMKGDFVEMLCPFNICDI